MALEADSAFRFLVQPWASVSRAHCAAPADEGCPTEGEQKQLIPALQSVLREQLQIAFHNSFEQAVAAVEAALSVSHVDGPHAGRTAGIAAVKAQAPKTWAPILSSADKGAT